MRSAGIRDRIAKTSSGRSLIWPLGGSGSGGRGQRWLEIKKALVKLWNALWPKALSLDQERSGEVAVSNRPAN